MEAREAFLHAGGKSFSYISCLNDDPSWIEALADISEQHLQGWPTTQKETAQQAAEGIAARARAKALGASN